MVDGTVDAATAVMFEPYTNGKNGIAFWTQEELNRSVAQYDREGLQVIDSLDRRQRRSTWRLDAYENAEKVNGTSGHAPSGGTRRSASCRRIIRDSNNWA